MPFGKTSPLLGNGPQLSNAIGNRNVPQLAQVSANVPFQGGQLIPPSPSQMPAPSMPMPPQGQSGVKPPQTEEEMIVKALINRLKTLGDTLSVKPTQM